MTEPCPRCTRANAVTRVKCLYCGAPMPAPRAAPPPAPRRALPADFDALVRSALTGGGVGALKQALEEAPVEEPSADPHPASDPSDPPASSTLVPDAPVPPAPPPPAPADPLTALADAVVAAQGARAASDPVAYARALDAADEALRAARAAPPAPAALPDEGAPEPSVRLPPARHPWLLALGPEAGTDPAVVARALGVDLPTARNAVLGGTRVALRSPDRVDLDERVSRAIEAGVRALVLERAALGQERPARAVVTVDDLEAWRVVDLPLWEDRPDPTARPEGVPVPLGTPWVLVQGEVEERRASLGGGESRWHRSGSAPVAGAGGETRIAVFDLHTDAGILRVCEGVAALRARGAALHAQRRSLRALIEAIVERWPALRVEPRRACAAAERAGERRSDGWAAWEEHSRVCGRVWAPAALVTAADPPG